MQLGESIELIDKGIRALDKWKEVVDTTRSDVDNDENHFPYDNKKLFDRTRNIIRVLKDLRAATMCLWEFYSFLGDDLKKVTGDP